MQESKITLRALLFGTVFAAIFAVLTVIFENRYNQVVTANQIAVLPYVLLILTVILINPVCRLIRFIRPFTTGEVLLVFVMGSVSAGIPTFGLASQLTPVMTSLFNQQWNNDQAKWEQWVEPFLNDRFFVGPGNDEAALAALRQAEADLQAARDRGAPDTELAKLSEAVAFRQQVVEANRAGIQATAKAYVAALEAVNVATAASAPTEQLAPLEATLAARKKVLEALEQMAFDRVRVFRRGLPRGERAFPGFVPMPGETSSMYVARFRRLVHGRSSLGDVKHAIDALVGDGPADLAAADGHLRNAMEELNQISSIEGLQATKTRYQSEYDTANASAENTRANLEDLRSRLRLDPDPVKVSIAEISERLAVLQQRLRVSPEWVAARQAIDKAHAALAGAALDAATVAAIGDALTEAEDALSAVAAGPEDAAPDGLTALARLPLAELGSLRVDVTASVGQGEKTVLVLREKLGGLRRKLAWVGTPEAAIASLAKIDPAQPDLSLEAAINHLRAARQAVEQSAPNGPDYRPLTDAIAAIRDLLLVHLEQEALDERLVDLNAAKLYAEKRVEEAQIQINTTMKVASTVTAISDLRATLADGTLAPTAAATRLQELARSFPQFDASLRRYLLGDVPWSIWLRPLFNWLSLIALTYLMLMTFNVLIFRQWAHNERLIYPLAELPEILVGAEPGGGKRTWVIPPIFRSGLFWIGFAIAAGFLGWNLICLSGIAPGLTQIPMTVEWKGYIQGSKLEALIPGARFGILFTMIGLAFLIPANISFSLWFFWILYMFQLCIIVWAGHGVNESSFSTDWYYSLNFRTSEGGGALIVFAAVVLYKCRRYLLCGFRPRDVAGLELSEQRELRLSSLLFWGSSVALVLMLWLGLGANFWYTLLLYVFILITTIGLVRAVTEGGVLGFQAWFNPFHMIRSLFGFNHSWTAPSLFAPLLVFYSILFLDIKTFIAPAMANTLKIREDLRMSRWRFHLAILLGIGVTVVIALAMHIMLGYRHGADQGMNSWFYSSFPSGFFSTPIAKEIQSPTTDTSANGIWIGIGALMMTGLLYCRQFLFWLPHPIGLIMLVNPIMRVYWFSIFIGWLGKVLVTRYGNKDTYNHVRYLFIGLIAGELAIVTLAMFVSVWLGTKIGIDLNRN